MKKEKYKWQFLELPDGITTSNGNWYHISREGIEKYVPGLLKKYSLDSIIRLADSWLKSPDAVSLILYFILVIAGVNAVVSASVVILYYILWFLNLSAFIILPLNPVVKFLQNDGVIYGISAAALIYLSTFDITAMWIGILLLFLLKVGLLGMLLKYVVNRKKENITLEDRVLNMLLIKLGMKENILTENIQNMEQELTRIVNYHKSKKK